MTSKSIGKFAIVIIIIALLAYVAAFGLQVGNTKISKVFDKENGIKRGIDLAGGSALLFEPAEGAKGVNDAAIDAAQEVLRTRLTAQGYPEATVAKQGKAKKIYVFKMKRKKNERSKKGHRQPYTKITIESINA